MDGLTKVDAALIVTMAALAGLIVGLGAVWLWRALKPLWIADSANRRWKRR